jgi:hypothetical protein
MAIVTTSGVWGSSMNDVRLVGDGGVVYHSALNGGAPASSTETSHTNVALRAIHGSGPNDLWAVGGSHVLHSSLCRRHLPAERAEVARAHHGGPKLKKKPNGTRLAASTAMPKQLRSSSRLTSGTAMSMLIVVCDTPNQSPKMRSE